MIELPSGFCGYLRSKSCNLPVKVVKLSNQLHITVTYKNRVFDLFDALAVYECEGETVKLIRRLAYYLASPKLLPGEYTLQELCLLLDLQ